MSIGFLSRMSGDPSNFASRGIFREADQGAQSGSKSDGISREGQGLAQPNNWQEALDELFGPEFQKACEILDLDLNGVIRTITDPKDNLLPSISQEQVRLLTSFHNDLAIAISPDEAKALATKIKTRLAIQHEKIDIQALANCKSVIALATLVLETKLKDIDASYPTVTEEK